MFLLIYHFKTQLQSNTGNRNCSEICDNKDQTWELAALQTESNQLKTELNVLKDLMLRQVGFCIMQVQRFTNV